VVIDDIHVGSLRLPDRCIVGCADQSKGTALNECRMQHYRESAAAQGELIPDCYEGKIVPNDIAMQS
jgi:hypothetical protein